MARHAPGAGPPGPDVRVYADRLRPFVDEALRVRAAWLACLDGLEGRGDYKGAGDEALSAADALGQLRAGLRAVQPPPACRRAHAALDRWLEALRDSCLPLAEAPDPGRAEVALSRERLRAVADAAERFNRESRRIAAVLRAVPLLQRRVPIRPFAIVAAALVFAVGVVLVPPVVLSKPLPPPAPTATPTPARGLIKLTPTPAPTRTPTIVRRVYSEWSLLASLQVAALAQTTVGDLDLKLAEPNQAVVFGTVDGPSGPARVRATFIIGLTADGKVQLWPSTLEGMDGGSVPPALAQALPRRMDELNAQVASRLPGGPIRSVYVQGGQLVFEVEQA